MSLKNAGKNVFGKEDGALEAFRRYLELDEKSEATIRKYMAPSGRSRSLDIKIGWESGTRCVAQIPC